MGRKLYLDPAAEKEATDIGRKFMNSADVAGDMSRVYGADLTSIRLHTDESAARRTAERGVDAYSTGRDIFFARGAFDRSDPASRGLLAHELSHSLQQGVDGGGMGRMTQSAPVGAEQGGLLSWFRGLFHRKKKPNPEDGLSFAEQGGSPTAENVGRFFRSGNTERIGSFGDLRREGLEESVRREYLDGESRFDHGLENWLGNASGTVNIRGVTASRMLQTLEGPAGGDLEKEDVGVLYRRLLYGSRYRHLNERRKVGTITPQELDELESYRPEEVADMDGEFDLGMTQLKSIHLNYLRNVKTKYGLYGTQLHPEDFLTRVGPEFFADMSALQDTEQMMIDGSKYFDYENSADDQEYRTLSNYYNSMYSVLQGYISSDKNQAEGAFTPNRRQLDFIEAAGIPLRALEDERAMAGQGAGGFSPEDQAAYEGRVRKRFGKKSLRDRLFGRFAKKK